MTSIIIRVRIWKIQAPGRVCYFVWMLCYDILLTNLKKSRMGLGCAMCNYCGDIEEDMLHVLRDFPLLT